MKYLIYCIAFISFSAFSQSKYLTKTGTVNFEASVPSFEEVKASNNAVTAILDAEKGEFAALVLVNGFRFKNALMEEHFNENYAESHKYPKATFKGKISDFDLNKLSSKNSSVKIDGELTFHGKTKTIKNIPIKISVENGIVLEGNFKTKASDFDIEIPKIVSNKIAEDIDVSFQFKLKKK